VPPNDPLDHPIGGEVVEAPRLTVALAGGVDEGKVLWGAGLSKTPLEGDGEFFGEPYTDESAGGHGVAVHYHAGSVFGRDDLVTTQKPPVPLLGLAFWCALVMLSVPEVLIPEYASRDPV
jgi:hypothetical protein